MEQIGVNLAYRWFLDLEPHAEVWDPTTFTQNREPVSSAIMDLPGIR